MGDGRKEKRKKERDEWEMEVEERKGGQWVGGGVWEVRRKE